jgi:hypothetical protein
VTGDHHHADVVVLLAELGEGVETVDPLHLDVEQDQVERALPMQVERLATRRGGGDLIPLVSEHLGEDVPDRALVVDHQQATLSHWALR